MYVHARVHTYIRRYVLYVCTYIDKIYDSCVCLYIMYVRMYKLMFHDLQDVFPPLQCGTWEVSSVLCP